MKNINYDLLKLLHMSLDKIWRLEKHYINDSDEARCHSAPAMRKMLEEEKKQAETLRAEIKARMDAGKFD